MRNLYTGTGLIIMTIALGGIIIHQEFLNPNKKATSLVTRGNLFLEQNTAEAWRKSVDIFATAASEYPETLKGKEALFYLASAYEKLGMKDIAVAKLRRLLKSRIAPELKRKARFKIAKLQILKSYTDEGVNGLLVLLSQTDDRELRSEIYFELANYYARQKHLGKAKKNYEIALAEDPENNAARLKLAALLGRQGNDQSALNAYENYLSFSGQNEKQKSKVLGKYKRDILTRGMAYFNTANYDKAKELFKIVTERFKSTPQADEALYFSGLAEFKRGSYIRAVDYFNKVLTQSPERSDQEALIKKGESYYQIKNYVRAAAAFSEYRNKYPGGKYNQIAADWEEESRRALQEKQTLESGSKVVEEIKENNIDIEPVIEGEITGETVRIERIEEPDMDEEDSILP